MKALLLLLCFPQDTMQLNRKSSAIFNWVLPPEIPVWAYVHGPDFWGLFWLSTEKIVQLQYLAPSLNPTSFSNDAWTYEISDFDASQFLSCLHIMRSVYPYTTTSSG